MLLMFLRLRALLARRPHRAEGGGLQGAHAEVGLTFCKCSCSSLLFVVYMYSLRSPCGISIVLYAFFTCPTCTASSPLCTVT